MGISPLVRDAVIARVAEGDTLAQAAAHAGMPLNTIKSWITRGRREASGNYHDFDAAVLAARASSRRGRARRPPHPSRAGRLAGADVADDPVVGPMTEQEFREHLEAGIRNQLGWAAKLWSDRFLPADPPPPPPPKESNIARLARTARPWSEQNGGGGLLDCDAVEVFAELDDLAVSDGDRRPDAA